MTSMKWSAEPKNGGLNGGRLLVYYNRPYTNDGNPPQLIEITAQGQKILKTYTDDPDLYSVEIGRMRQVLADMKELAPAEDYGMIFWGHATAWMTHPEDMDQSKASRSYGTDRDKWMSSPHSAKPSKAKNSHSSISTAA